MNRRQTFCTGSTILLSVVSVWTEASYNKGPHLHPPEPRHSIFGLSTRDLASGASPEGTPPRAPWKRAPDTHTAGRRVSGVTSFAPRRSRNSSSEFSTSMGHHISANPRLYAQEEVAYPYLGVIGRFNFIALSAWGSTSLHSSSVNPAQPIIVFCGA